MINHKKSAILVGVIIVGLMISFIALFLGRYGIEKDEIIKLLSDSSYRNTATTSKIVIFKIRLPRILISLLVGSALSVAGTSYQSIFMNPMVSPNLLGVTSGAGFGASVAILLGASSAGIQLAAFIAGLATVALTYGISYAVGKKSTNSITTIILAGMVVSSLFNAFISVSKFLADPNDTLPEITFWLMGSLSGVTMADFADLALPIVLGLIPLFLLRWKMNLMALGEEEAMSIGLNTKRTRVIIVLSSTMIVSASVAVCGIIGWIGIVIPHISRMLVGPDNRWLIPISFSIGGIYLLIIDTIARTLVPIEIPLSILTSIIGAPFFVYLMFKQKGAWT